MKPVVMKDQRSLQEMHLNTIINIERALQTLDVIRQVPRYLELISKALIGF